MYIADVGERLRKFRVPPSAVEQVGALLPIDVLGVLLYGSYARGDYGPTSDVDVLALAAMPAGTRRTEHVSVSTYTPGQLATAAGTLFGMHLARDGVVMGDTDNQLRELLGSMGQPNPAELLNRVRHLAAVLDDRPVDAHLPGRVRVARYLVRSAIYVSALAEGRPSFSVPELAERLGQPELVTVLASNPDLAPAPTREVLEDLLVRLDEVVGAVATNTYGSTRNLVVAEWYEDPARASLGALALVSEGAEFDYAAIAKVLL